MINGLMMLIALVGAAAQKAAMALIVRPFMYYSRLLQLQLLGNQIDEQTRTMIVQQMTLEYFLGNSVQEQSLSESKVKQ